jgi:hypothetical protein
MTTTQRFLGAMTALMIAARTNAQSAPSPAEAPRAFARVIETAARAVK